MKKIFLWIIFLLFLTLLSSCNSKEINQAKKYYSTGSVFSGSIHLGNSFVWYIKWSKMINLATKVGWRVTGIYVKEWDYVRKGDLLVKLDSLEAKVWYSSAKNIINTLSIMKESTSKMFDEQILSMQAKIKQVQLWDEWVKWWVEDMINITNAQLEVAKTWVETAKATLEHTKMILNTKKEHIYNNSKDAIVWAVILDTNIIDFVDVLLWVTQKNKDKNNAYEQYLSAEDTRFLKESEVKFSETYKVYLEYKEFYETKIDWKNPNKEVILKWLNDGEKLAEKLKNLLSVTYKVLDNSIANVYFSLETINTYKSRISNFWNNLESSLLTVSWDYILWLKWSRQGIDDFEKGYSMQIDVLEKQVLLAKNTYTQYQAMSKWQIRKISTKSEVTNNQLKEIISW